MKKTILLGLILFAMCFVYGGRSATPHPVYIELHDSEGKLPAADSLEVSCWLSHKPDQVLDLSDSNLIYPVKDLFLQIQCSGFDSWTGGDTLNVDIKDKKSGEELLLELELTFENFQLIEGNKLKKPEQGE